MLAENRALSNPEVYHRLVRKKALFRCRQLTPVSPKPPTMGHSHGLRRGTRVCCSCFFEVDFSYGEFAIVVHSVGERRMLTDEEY